MHVGKTIKGLRTSKNLSQEELAQALNVEQSRISDIERRETLNMKSFFRVAEALGVSPSELMAQVERDASCAA